MKNLTLILVLAACGGSSNNGDDTPHNVDPHLIAGGGVADSPLGGTLHVYALE